MDSSFTDVRSWAYLMNPSTQYRALASNGAAKDHEKGMEIFKSTRIRLPRLFLADVRSWAYFMNPSTQNRALTSNGAAKDHEKGIEIFKSTRIRLPRLSLTGFRSWNYLNDDATDDEEFKFALADARSWADLMNPSSSNDDAAICICLPCLDVRLWFTRTEREVIRWGKVKIHNGQHLSLEKIKCSKVGQYDGLLD
jgi:hypothetical protein